MTTIHVYEPALCCNTGVCGPDLDDALVSFTADLSHLKELGVDIERHNLANDPTAFAANDTVRAFLKVAGSDGLPLTLVDGITVQTGSYPARAQLERYAGLTDTESTTPATDADASVVPSGVTSLVMAPSDGAAEAGSCCGPTGCC